MTIEESINVTKGFLEDTPTRIKQFLQPLLTLAEDYQKVGEGVLPTEKEWGIMIYASLNNISDKLARSEWRERHRENYKGTGMYSFSGCVFSERVAKVIHKEVKLRLLKNRMSVDKLGIMIYGILARLPEKEAIEDWTAKHFLSSDKRRSCKLAKSIHKEMSRRLGI